ncbi:hypothetical protein [Nonomuraea sp. NPDC049480]|uniref:hypothetical protein n=1 Tax=Nonomuraea sp. NPDC049480 TaxID=3364353 RepID=UPI00378A626A
MPAAILPGWSVGQAAATTLIRSRSRPASPPSAAPGAWPPIAEAGTDPATSKPTLAWHFDQSAIDAEAATDGWYALLTNLYLKNNRRLNALITVICLALLIFCLIERQVRQTLAAQGTTKVDGLYAGRPAIPTGRLILDALPGIRLIPGTGQSPPTIPATHRPPTPPPGSPRRRSTRPSPKIAHVRKRVSEKAARHRPARFASLPLRPGRAVRDQVGQHALGYGAEGI